MHDDQPESGVRMGGFGRLEPLELAGRLLNWSQLQLSWPRGRAWSRGVYQVRSSLSILRTQDHSPHLLTMRCMG